MPPRAFRTFVPLAAAAFGSVASLAQESAAFFYTPMVVLDGTGRFERTLDLDGDGYQDAFGWYPKDNYYAELRLLGYINDQAGGLV